MDRVTFELVVSRFRELSKKKFPWVVAISEGSDGENSLLYQTDFGSFQGKVTERDGCFVFQVRDLEITVPVSVFLGEPH